jgi:hypothetical protein
LRRWGARASRPTRFVITIIVMYNHQMVPDIMIIDESPVAQR